jgi:Putative zinc-finger/FecR protein
MFGHVTKLLTAYHHDELSPEDRRRVDNHVAACARCRQELEDVGRVVRLVARGLTDGALVQESRHDARSQRWALLAVATALVLTTGIYVLRQSRLPAWEVESANGDVGKLRVGQWLETSSSGATVRIPDIGEVLVESNSRLRLLASQPQDHRMQLEHGTLHATVWAPPRLFFVETPSATAIDLGCAYTLTVDDAGASVLTVTTGLVELDSAGRASIVRAGWSAKTRRNGGPGTPYLSDMRQDLQQALDDIDFGASAASKNASLDLILRESKDNDLITLWHLLPRVDLAARRKIYDRMIALGSAPDGVTAEGTVALDPGMMEQWKSQLGLVW